ncbi:MAG: cupredoxin domain-containing protein [Dehalococcoidia bacterium]
MNTQKQISLMVVLVFVLLGACGAYTVYDQNRENSALAFQNETLAERGARIFARYCRQCHGNAGEGRIGPRLDRPELRDPNTRAETQIWVTDTITCGRIGKIMPPWAIREGGALNDEQIKDVMTLITTGGTASGTGGHGWEKAGEFSAVENQTAPVPSVDDVLKGSAITGATTRTCGQLAPATETPVADNGQLPAGLKPADQWVQNATDNKFSVTAIAVTAGKPATVDFNNKGAAIHNFEVLDGSGAVQKDDSGKPISVPLTDGGKSNSVTFTLATPGVYSYRCQVHPTEMTGKLYVVGPDGTASSGAPGTGSSPTSPGAAGGTGVSPNSPAASGTPSTGAGATAPTTGSPTAANPPASGPVAVTQTATDNKYSVTQIKANAGQAVTVTLENKGSAIHNFDVLNVKDASGKDIKMALLDAGKSATITFTISQKGAYNFHCDVHPDEMKGTITIQ